MLQRFKNIFAKEKYFLVTSAGYTGSWWLATSLHHHPDIKCSMGIDALPIAFDYTYNYDEMLQLFREHQKWEKYGVAYRNNFYEVLDKITSKVNISTSELNNFKEIIAKLEKREINSLPNHMFAELRSVSIKDKAHFIGNVHGVTAGHYAHALKTFHKPFDGRKVVAFDMIRHPVTRLDTFVNNQVQWYEGKKYDLSVKNEVDQCLHENANEAIRIEKKYGIDFSITRNKVYFQIEHINSHLTAVYHDVLHTLNMPRVTFEKLRSNPDYYRDFVKKIMYGRDPGQDYIDFVFKPESLNAGRVSLKSYQVDRSDPIACFRSWSDWEKERFKKRVRELNLVKFYRQFDYDLSFIEKEI